MRTGSQSPEKTKPSRTEQLFLAANFTTWLGNGTQLIAASVLVLRAEHSTLAVGWVFVVVAIPQALFSLYFGRLADRFDRRTMCMICDLCSAGVAVVLPVWLILGGAPNVAAYVVSFALAIVAAAFVPASNALIKERVSTERLAPFNANFTIATQAGSLLSGAAGGFMIEFFGLRPMFFFNAVTFAFSACCWIVMGRRAAEPTAQAAASAEPARAGEAGAPLRRLGILFAVGSVNITVSNALLVVVVIQTFRQSTGIYGAVDALAGIGILVGAASYKRAVSRLSNHWLALIGFIGNASLIALEPFRIGLLIGVIPFAAVSFGIANVSSRTLLTRAIPPERAGRVFGAVNAFGLGAALVATAAIAGISDHISIRYAFWTLSLLIGIVPIVVILSLRGWYAAKNVETPAVLQPSP
jgi:MFS family permease